MIDHETKRQRMIESFFVLFLTMIVLAIVIYIYRLYPWYYFTCALYTGLSYIPDGVRSVVFFWTRENQHLIGPMANDLLAHKGDFDIHYADEAIGIKKFKSINFLAFAMFYPYLGTLLVVRIYTYYKETVNIRHPKQMMNAMKDMHFVPAAYEKETALQSYIKSQTIVWPYARPIQNIMLEMINNPSLENEWYAMSPIPEQWMIDNNLVNVVSRKARRALLTKKERQLISLDMDRAYLVLKEDLGPLFSGSFGSMPFHWRAVAAVFILQIFGQIAKSRQLNRALCFLYEINPDPLSAERNLALRPKVEEEINQVFQTYEQYIQVDDFDEKEFDDPFDPFLRSFKEVNSELELLNTGIDALKEVFTRHAYRSTVIMGLMVASWRYGVLSSAEMIWVKTIDRELWFLISQCGRKSCLMGALPAWSHYLGETSANCRLVVPQMSPGLRSLDYSMFNSHDNYTPHEQFEMGVDAESTVGGVGSAITFNAGAPRDYTKM